VGEGYGSKDKFTYGSGLFVAMKGDTMYDEDYLIDDVGFADPGGRSSLRAATRKNPRIFPCPNCGRENMLTRIDKRCGYQCDICADQAEGWRF
jgi:hypothetical protein